MGHADRVVRHVWILATFGPENWRYVFLLIPLAMIPIWIGYWLFATKKRYEKFERDHRAGLTKPLAAADADEAHRRPRRTGPCLRNPNIVFPSLASMLGIAIYTGISFWLPPYIAFVGNYSFAEAAAYSAVFTITGGIGQILWGWVSDHLGRKFTGIAAFAWLGVGIFLLQYAGMGLGWLIVLQLFAGMATNGVFPVIFGFVSDSAEPGAIGTANSVMLTAMYLGGLSPLILGVLIGAGGGFASSTGYEWGLYVMVGACVLAIVLPRSSPGNPSAGFRHLDRALVTGAGATCPPESSQHESDHDQGVTMTGMPNRLHSTPGQLDDRYRARKAIRSVASDDGDDQLVHHVDGVVPGRRPRTAN